ncbi:hypothetical protein [Acetobacter estunensis]|uniref:hypothetical protein n=1 Tax=Acetobacter estunensis TaxID=104097 RepID=UPI001C2DBADE|nr:hypothetical protein [Acetobacter estunensis]MBV1837163.1 hypothetical protein [Acetobacter estunensis]
MMDSKEKADSPETEAGQLVGLYGLAARTVAGDRLERAHQLGLTDAVDHWYRVYRLLSESMGSRPKAPPSGVGRRGRKRVLPRLRVVEAETSV